MRNAPTLALLITVIPAAFAASGRLAASERQFTYTHESAVLAPGQHEVELWATERRGRAASEYRAFKSRLELEAGVAANTQLAVYLNYSSTTVDGLTESSVDGVSVELKYRFSDPVADGIGTALYLEGTAGSAEHGIEVKGIADWRADAWTIAANVTGELAWAEENDAGSRVIEHETELKLSAGVAYALSEQWSVGLELDNRNEFKDGTWESSPLYLGPVVHWSSEAAWVTLTVLPQISNLGGEADAGRRDLTDHERLEVRCIVGMHF